MLTLRKFLYFPHILTEQEKRTFLILLILSLVSGGWLFARVYIAFTVSIPEIGGVYTEAALREPRIINPIFATQDTDRDIARLLYSGIVRYDKDGNAEPDLAEHIETSEDGKIYTIALHNNILWHDGEKLNADDILFTVQTIQNPQYKSPLRANWQGVSAEKVNEHTVRFVLRTPYAPFIENLAVGILPQHLWKNVGPEQFLLHELNLKPVGTGPYMFGRIQQARDGTLQVYELFRNPHYYHEGPYLTTIAFRFYKTEEDVLMALRRGDVDAFGPISEANISHLKQDAVSVLRLKMPRIFGLFFNPQKSPLFSAKEIREAISRAVDKEAIAKNASSGGAIPLDAPLLLDTKNPSPSSEKNHYDLARAQALLDQNGWKDDNGDGILEKKTKQKGKENVLTLRATMVTSDWPDLIRAAELIKSMLHKIGMEIIVQSYPFTELESNIIRPRNFDMLLFGQVYGYEADPFPFWHSSQLKDPGLNIALYSNKRVDKILEEARRSGDPARRAKDYLEFETILAQDIPAVFLYSQLYLYLVPKDMHGIELSRISLPADRFNNINTWYRETKRVWKQ